MELGIINGGLLIVSIVLGLTGLMAYLLLRQW